MRQPESITIDGYTYRVSPLGAIQGQKLLAKILKCLVPIFASTQGVAPEARARAIVGALTEHLSPELLEEATQIMAESTLLSTGEKKEAGGRLSKVYDEHFAGRYLEAGEWLKFALEVNYARFFSDLMTRVTHLTGVKSEVVG